MRYRVYIIDGQPWFLTDICTVNGKQCLMLTTRHKSAQCFQTWQSAFECRRWLTDMGYDAHIEAWNRRMQA